MSVITSNRLPIIDGSSESLRGAASDIGEVIALLRGGAHVDADTLSRLCLSLRATRVFLVIEADNQRYREQISRDAVITEVVTEIMRSPSVAMPPKEVTRAHS